MATMYLSSFKLDDREYVGLPNLDVTNLPISFDPATKTVIIPDAEKVYINDKTTSIQIVVKPEHRERGLYKVFTFYNGGRNGDILKELYHNDFDNEFGTNFENDGILTVDTSALSFNDRYTVELQMFRDDPADPSGPPIESAKYYLEVFIDPNVEPTPPTEGESEPEPEPIPTIQDIESELFIKVTGKWFRLVDKIN